MPKPAPESTASVTVPGHEEATAVPLGTPRSTPVWKCEQVPREGSSPTPVQPKGWVIGPISGQGRATSAAGRPDG